MIVFKVDNSILIGWHGMNSLKKFKSSRYNGNVSFIKKLV